VCAQVGKLRFPEERAEAFKQLGIDAPSEAPKPVAAKAAPVKAGESKSEVSWMKQRRPADDDDSDDD
jgi:hypothetical protein